MRFNPLALSVLATALAGCSEPNAYAPPPAPEVTVASPQRETITTHVEYTGRTEPAESVEVRARVTGVLETIHFDDAADVEAGDDLFTLEKATYAATVSGAEASLQQAEANRGIAEVTLERVQLAFEKNAATEVEVKRAQADFDAAVAAVSVAQSALDRAKVDLAYTDIAAPISGRISRQLVSVGNLVGPNSASLLTTIVDNDPMYAYFTVSERDVLEYQERRRERGGERLELSAELLLTSGDRNDVVGTVDFADNRIDSRTGTIQARASFDNPDGFLVGGMFVRVLIPEPPREAILVPELAIQRDMVGAFLLIVGAEGKAERRDIETGDRLGRRREVKAGLDGSEQVIVMGLQRCRPGLPVTVSGTYAVEADAAEPPASDAKPAADGTEAASDRS